jgi:hypothetical protein
MNLYTFKFSSPGYIEGYLATGDANNKLLGLILANTKLIIANNELILA